MDLVSRSRSSVAHPNFVNEPEGANLRALLSNQMAQSNDFVHDVCSARIPWLERANLACERIHFIANQFVSFGLDRFAELCQRVKLFDAFRTKRVIRVHLAAFSCHVLRCFCEPIEARPTA